MAKFRVRYTGQLEEEVEADGQSEAECDASYRNEYCWIAEEVGEEGEE